MSDKQIITISRMYGSGGREIGRLLSERLGIGFVDKDILWSIIDGEDLGQDRTRKRIAEDNKNVFRTITSAMGFVNSKEIKAFEEEERLIRKIASEKSCVFVGRCADYVLSDYDNVINVFIYDSLKNRVKRAMEQEGISEDEARIWIVTTDSTRKGVYNRQTGQIWGEATNYHLSINAGELTPDKVVELIISYISLSK